MFSSQRKAKSYFNSRPHEEVDRVLTLQHGYPWYFNSRPHEEVDDWCTSWRNMDWYFNSRPHEEVDRFAPDCATWDTISTHDLTKRSTETYFGCTISGVFQLTTSRRGRRLLREESRHNCHFNSRPHEEVDNCNRYNFLSIRISTHDLTKRSTIIQSGFPLQITYFNSRPHEEVDVYLMQYETESQAFQLTTSRRGRLLLLYHVYVNKYFNSRPHEEVDLTLHW